MALFKNTSLDDRRNAAAAAKKATMEKFRALTAQINEGAAERSTARQAVISAREARAEKREAAGLANEARKAQAEALRGNLAQGRTGGT